MTRRDDRPSARALPSAPTTADGPIAAAITAALLDWYDANRRDLPWRAPPGQRPDPYAVWLSEIMLQQTTVATVARRYRAFLKRWPTLAALAAAPREDVLAAWAGLGYYARARNLHDCARQIVAHHGGRFPRTARELRDLPGIGPYTAAAIAAIAFGEPVAAVDGNAERVLARLFAVTEPLPAAKSRLRALAGPLVPHDRPGDFAQAVMDLGSLVCTPVRPDCGRCPLNHTCRGRAEGIAATLPRRAARRPRPLRRGVAFLVRRAGDDAVLLRRRPERGLLGGMAELPSQGWDGAPLLWPDERPFGLDVERVDPPLRHALTHFELELILLRARAPLSAAHAAAMEGAGGYVWCAPEDLTRVGLPSLMRKAVARLLDVGGGRKRRV